MALGCSAKVVQALILVILLGGITDNIECNDNEFKCRPMSKCVPRSLLNTINGCNFVSNREKLFLPCRSDEFACKSSAICLPRWSVRNGIPDCNSKEVKDSSDEIAPPYESCFATEFRCKNGRCIPKEWVMDDVNDCTGGSDENNPATTCIQSEEFRCAKSGRCLKRYRVKDDFEDCSTNAVTDDSDEVSAFPSCNTSTEFRCVESGRCIPRSWIADGTPNCINGSDELVPKYYQCTSDEFPCHNGRRCISLKYLCDGMDHCGDCSDEIESCIEPKMWRCPGDTNRTCIPQSYACDAFQDCPNGSDHLDYLPGFKCTATIAGLATSCPIPQWTLKDSHAICENKDDICHVNNTFQCEHCADRNTIIATTQLCNGVVDCRDLWDECLCFKNRSTTVNVELCDNVCYGIESPACDHCSIGQVFCPSELECINRSKLCNGVLDCPVSELDEKFCQTVDVTNKTSNDVHSHDFTCWEIPTKATDFLKEANVLSFVETRYSKTAMRCDGVFECARFEDECSSGCPNTSDYCNTIPLVNYSTPHIPGVTLLIRACSDYDPGELFDFIGFVGGKSICDGIQECNDGADENSCPGRHYCSGSSIQWPAGVKEVVSVGSEELCNFRKDCIDFSDERNCPNTTHFYCQNGDPLFVHVDVVTDGKQDCSDNSDECPPSAFDNNPFSSRFEMIKNKFLRYFIWVMATIAIFGNIGVVLETYFLDLRAAQSSQLLTINKCNKLIIINLAVSDFLMGVCLMAIGSKSLSTSGNYCAEEKEWRISGQCSAIGTVTVISTEASVFTLVVLTSYRLYSVYRPFTSRFVEARKVLFAVIATWFAAIVLAVAPLIPKLNQSMLTEVLLTPSVHFKSTTVSWSEFQEFAIRAYGLEQSNRTSNDFQSWTDAVDFIRTVDAANIPEVIGYFGYYSAHGVCLPRFFRTDINTPLHALSLIVVIINFLCLAFIVVSYCMIYHESTSTSKKVGGPSSKISHDKKARSVQTKITILIATDMCCWLPICVMTFISQSGHLIPEIVYAFAAILLLPINSSVNPLIYSNGFELSRNILATELRRRMPYTILFSGDSATTGSLPERKADKIELQERDAE